MYSHLNGICVLDTTRYLPGPLCTRLLADMGADVIVVEPVSAGDPFRYIPPLAGHSSSTYYTINRNKRSIALDYTSSAGRDVLYSLIKRADVFIVDMKPKKLLSLGIDDTRLRSINERLIYCSLAGFDHNGPYSGKATHDLNILALSGLLDLMGEQDGPPMVPPVQIAGTMGSHTALSAILAALYKRERTGTGESLTVSLFDAVSTTLCLLAGQFSWDLDALRRGETMAGGGYACYNVYECADDTYLAIACIETKRWEKFCQLIGQDDLIADQFSSGPAQDMVKDAVRNIIKTKTRDAWCALFDPHDLCITPVLAFNKSLSLFQTAGKSPWSFRHIDGNHAVLEQTIPYRSSRSDTCDDHPAPAHGADTADILSQLGYTETDRKLFEQDGVIPPVKKSKNT